jgi:methionine-rich copper-binding protein CopC
MPRRPRPLGRHLIHAGAGALLAAAWALAIALPAQGHTSLVSSSPSDGDVLAAAPAEVTFTFDEAVLSPAFVSVIAPDGADVAQGDAIIDGPTVTQAVRLVPEQGVYAASYRVVSDDGHPVTGTIRFTVDAAHGTTPPPAQHCADSCASTGAGTPFWHRESTWVVIALGALAVSVALVFAFGLRSGAESDAGGDG